MKNNIDYTIAGRSKQDGQYYLVYTCGGDKKHAESVLAKAKNDEKLAEQYDNLIIQEHVSDDCWWNHGTN